MTLQNRCYCRVMFIRVNITELYLIYLEIALSNNAEAKNMADLDAVGGRLAAEVNGFS